MDDTEIDTTGADQSQDPIDDLVVFTLDQGGRPMNFWAVAALLESRGLRDIDAIEKFGKRHIFELAKDVNDRCLEEADKNPSSEKDKKKPGILTYIGDFFKFYSKGTVFALPMAGQIIAILVLRYSLWAWLEFTVMQASLVAIGTIASFVVSGGLIQAIGREGTFYSGQQNPILLERICYLLSRVGLIATLVLCVVVVVCNTILPYFKVGQLGIVLLYFGLLTPLWLLLAVLYMLQDNLAILICTLLGTAAVHLIMSGLSGSIHFAHSVGLLTASLCAGGWAWLRIQRKQKSADKKCHLARLPRDSILFYIIEPFLVYGTLYFTFLFVDRIVGWSASRYRLPVVVWFRTPYELGMDWALLSLVLTFAVLEYTVNQFNRIIIPVQQSVRAHDFEEHNRYFMRFYIRQNILLAIVACLSVVGTYLAVMELRHLDHIPEVRDFFASPITYFTYWTAAVGYTLLAFALLNALFFFSLAKPHIVIRCIAWGLLVDVVVGYILSRMISYEYSVFGLIFGAAVFAALIGHKALEMFRQLDYFYYSAF